MKVLEKLRLALVIVLVFGLTAGVTACGGEEHSEEEVHGEHPGDDHEDHDEHQEGEHPSDDGGEHPSDGGSEHPTE